MVYFPEATRVAMYLGNGRVVRAPRPGAADGSDAGCFAVPAAAAG
ncbi:hypothetical protein MBT84_14975 [Streptomyces sp. MBT84]|jgi:hypothetical protein|nr:MULTISPECIES: hypothetical protein [unclassified Streptomyces]MBW8700903.1 hypothetical protein [Streptomyces sp. MBT84]REE63342.1 hypothetical protein BX257_5984 [Streptomyces sp. 3212.3]